MSDLAILVGGFLIGAGVLAVLLALAGFPYPVPVAGGVIAVAIVAGIASGKART